MRRTESGVALAHGRIGSPVVVRPEPEVSETGATMRDTTGEAGHTSEASELLDSPSIPGASARDRSTPKNDLVHVNSDNGHCG